MNLSKAYEELSRKVKGEILLPGEPEYRESCRIWNTRLSGQPTMVVKCLDAADVSQCIMFFADEGTSFSVKGGGHSFAGNGISTGSPMIDLSSMKDMKIDAEGQRAWIEPGIKWGEAYERAMEHRLTLTGGTVSGVGVSGYTLGGGTGYLARQYGLAIDNLLSVQIVAADGAILSASEEENSDLFWAVRGGSGNFGIVTKFEYKLHPVSENIFAGQVMYPYEKAAEVMHAYRKVMKKAPHGFTCYPCAMKIPPLEAFPGTMHHKTMICLVFAHMGDQQIGQKISKELRSIGSPILDTSGPQPYLDVQRAFDAGCPDGQRWYSKSNYMDDLSDEAIGTFIEKTAIIPGEHSIAYIEPLGGAIAQVASDATAFPHRTARYSFNILAGWSDQEEDDDVMQWADDFQQEMASHSDTGVYVNLLSDNESHRLKDAYGSNLKKLQDLKIIWDPDKVFAKSYSIPTK